MKHAMFPALGAAVATAALGLALSSAARAEEPSVNPSALLLAHRSLAARGPVALSVAAEPKALHWAFETGFPLGLARRDASGSLHSVNTPWRLDAFVNASHDRQSVTSSTVFGYTLRLEHARERNAHWLGVSTGGTPMAADPGTTLHLGAGRVQMLGGVQAEFSWIASSVMFRNDWRWTQTRYFKYSVPGDTGSSDGLRDTSVTEPGDHAAVLNTPQASLRWQFGRLALGGVGGVTLAHQLSARRWAQVTAEWQLSKRVLLLASLGERPAPSLAFNTEAHPRTMLGIQVAPWATHGWAMSDALHPAATEWRTQVLPGNRLVVRVHCRDVTSVELAGDFTDWKPVALLRMHGGWWYESLYVPPGVHRVQLRLNGGAWQAPPGLPRADDGPGGPSGTLVVMPSAD